MKIRITKKGYRLLAGDYIEFYFSGAGIGKNCFARVINPISRRRLEIEIANLILPRTITKYIGCVDRI